MSQIGDYIDVAIMTPDAGPGGVRGRGMPGMGPPGVLMGPGPGQPGPPAMRGPPGPPFGRRF